VSLLKSAKSGLFWSTVDTVGVKVLSFVVSVFLARILSPKDFGLVGLIVIFVAIGKILIDSGMGSSLIRDNDSTELDFSTVFFANLFVSIILYILLYFSAPFISGFFGHEILVPIIRVYGLSYIISALFITQETKLIKDLKFKKIATLNMPSVLISGAIAIGMALNGYRVWSLVAMFLSNQIIKLILVWWMSDWKPSFQFSKKSFRYHFDYGYKLIFSGILGVLTKEMYTLAIGKKFDVASVGYYQRANSVKSYPVSTIGSILNRITFPILSKIKEDKAKISRIYQSILKVSFFVMTAVIATLIVVSEPLFIFLFTDKWSAAIPYFKIVALAGILVPIHSFNINVFRIYGRTDVLLKLSIIKNSLALLSIFVGIYFGIIGLLWASVIISIISLFINSYSSQEMIGYSTTRQLKDMLPTVLTGMFSYVVSSFLLKQIAGLHNVVLVITGAFLFLLLFLGANFLLKTDAFKETLEMGEKLIFQKG